MLWRSVEPLMGVDDDIFDYGTIWWFHILTFRKWLLRALPKVTRTRKEFVENGISMAKYGAKQYRRDNDREYVRSMR
jgi:hypothetical protein